MEQLVITIEFDGVIYSRTFPILYNNLARTSKQIVEGYLFQIVVLLNKGLPQNMIDKFTDRLIHKWAKEYAEHEAKTLQ